MPAEAPAASEAALSCCRFFGAEAMWERLTTSFGVLNKAGYGQHLFPICVGETGSYLGYDPNVSAVSLTK